MLRLRCAGRVFSALLLLFTAFGALCISAAAAQSPSDVVLKGVLHDADNQSYRELPFQVPPGVTKISVQIAYTGRDQGTTLVFGLFDPQRMRGWGGGVKRAFTVAETFATPSFLSGPIPTGQWRLSLGVSSIRKGASSTYEANIHFSGDADMDTITTPPIQTSPGWYRGDLHTHTGHSDGACLNPGGRAAPCPLFLTLKAALDHGLDFVAVTDHNVASQYGEMADLAPYFDTLLLIPGREITTSEGHFNLIGATRFVNFQLGSPPGRDMNAVLRDAHATQGFVAINHPEIPTGEDCLGCGWSAKNTDFDPVDAIEIANGGVAADHGGFPEGLGSGIGFWEALLNQGRRITGVGGSDNHDAVDGSKTSPVGSQSPVGLPTTVVFADSLSQPAIMKGLRAGRVFIDLENIPGRLLDIAARSGAATATMGQVLVPRAGAPINVEASVSGFKGARLELIVDGRRDPVQKSVEAPTETVRFEIPAGTYRHWFRIDCRNNTGQRIAISNPIYIAPPDYPR